jgi:uncharacterized protein YggT (Ycf19 family)
MESAMFALIASALFWFYWLVGIYVFMICLRVIVAWLSSVSNPYLIFLVPATDPGLNVLRKLIPLDLTYGGFDFTPLSVLVTLIFARKFLKGFVSRYY